MFKLPYSDAEILKNTYAGLVVWVKELLWMLEWQRCLNIHNTELRHFRSREKLLNEKETRMLAIELLSLERKEIIMTLEHEGNVMKEYATAVSDVISLDEFRKNHPRPKTGGSIPPEGDWLSGMVCGTEFLVRPKVNKTWILAKFMHAGLRAGCVLVIPMQGDEPIQDDKQWVWVDPAEFCKFWELRAILLIPEIVNEQHNLDEE